MISEGILNEAKDESIKFQNHSTSDDYSKKIQKLQDLLEKEISEEENINIEDIQDPEFQEQIKEIEHLKKQINDNNINDVDDNKYKDTLQILDNFKQDLENNFKSYEQLVNEKINIIKGSLNEQTNKFEDILKEINEAIKENINYGNSPVKELNVENVQDNKDINMDNKDNSNNNNLYDREINTQNKDNNIDNTFNNSMPKENKNYKRKNPNNKKNLLNENQINEKNKEMINTKGPIDTIKNNNDEIYEYLPEKKENSFINNGIKENNTYNSNGINFFRMQNNNLSNNTNNLNNNNLLDYEKPKEKGFILKYPTSNTVIINNKYNNNNSININNNNNNENKDLNDNQKKEGNQKLYQSINNIFFYDYQQKYIKDQQISEDKKEQLQKEIFNDKIKGKNILKDYYMNYIETIILPLFKKNKNIIQSKLETIKYNISIILECLGMNKNYYNNYFYQGEPGQKKKHFSRAQSIDALLKFRNEFQISKEVITDEALVNKLEDNNLNIYKTFGKIYG